MAQAKFPAAVVIQLDFAWPTASGIEPNETESILLYGYLAGVSPREPASMPGDLDGDGLSFSHRRPHRQTIRSIPLGLRWRQSWIIERFHVPLNPGRIRG